jgi:hypothetical protein
MGEGIALCRSGEYIKALSSFDKALKALGSDRSNPLYAEALFRKGDVLYNLGLYVDAIDNYEAARNQNIGNPLSSFALIVLCYLALISGYLYMKRGNPLSSVCLDMALIILSGLLAFCAVLAGFLDMRQISYFLLEVFIVFILALVLWVLFSPKGHNLKQKLDLSLFEFELNHYFISKYFSALSCSFVFLCSVVSILSYFHDTFLSNYPELSIIRGALAILLTSSLIISMPIFVGMISCKNIDDDIRSTVMICQFFYLSLIGLFMYWLLWSFGIQGFDHTTFYFFDLSFDINPLMLIMAVLFLFSFLFPYLYGWRRTKSARGSILARQNKWLDELADILKKPLTDQLVAASEGFADQLDAEKSDLIRVRANRAVLFMLIWKVDHDLDYRMKYLDFLSRLHDQLLYCIPQLEPVIIKQDVKAAKDIQGYLDVVLGLKNKTDERMALEGKSRPQLWIGLVSVASPILSPIITGLIVKLGVPMQSAGVTELIKGALTNLPSIS